MAGPVASILTESVTLAAIVAAPSAPRVASFADMADASSVEMPRRIAVICRARPPSRALAVPMTLTFSWSTSTLAISPAPLPWIDRPNFSPLTQSFNDSGTGASKVVTERFTRVSDTTLDYEATIVDPETYQDKIVLSFPMARSAARVFECACHEHNYSLAMSLAGARAAEETAAPRR